MIASKYVLKCLIFDKDALVWIVYLLNVLLELSFDSVFIEKGILFKRIVIFRLLKRLRELVLLLFTIRFDE